MNEFLTLNFPENELVLLPGTPNDDELLGGLQNEGLFGYSGSDRALGYDGDDWLFGNTGNDSLYGNIGADVLYGGKDSDYLFGGRDNDILFGNIGNDILSGELGNDTLIGGEGDDRFLLGSPETNLANADLILDYSAGEDWLELTDGLTFADIEIVAGTGENDTIVRDRATGESIAVLRGFDHSGGTEFGNDEMTLIRLHQIAPEMPEEPVEPPTEPPADPVTDAPEEVDGETSVVEIDRDIPQFETEEREVSVDPGNTPEDAYRLDVSSTTLVYSDRVSSSDTEDYYFFSVGAENSLSLDLDIFTGNAQLELLDSNQTAIGSSQDTGSSSNTISAPLDAGTYYIRVQQSDVVTTDYSLNLSVTPRMNGITTTGSQDEFQLFTEESTPLINLTPSDSLDTEAFRTDPRFSDIDGSGYATVILDTGIDLDHPFFGDRIVYSYDFVDGDGDASDRNGHGSNVSSIVASEDSSYPGIAPGADIIHLKVLADNGSGSFSSVEQALQWVVENADTYNIVSVNMSLGASNFTEAISVPEVGISDELAALVEEDIIVVAAAGNSFYQYGPGVAYPAADPNVLAVGAVWDGNNGPAFWGDGAIDISTDADRITSFSQRHPELTDIFAPGAYITGAGPDGGTLTQAGTSQASPHIAGVAVLAQQLAERELGRRLTFDEFRNLLQSTGVTINDGDDEFDNVANTGADYSRVDVLALAEGIVALDSEAPPTPEPDPSDLVRYDFTYFYDGFTTQNDYYTGYVYGTPEELSVGTRYEIYPPIDNEAGFNGYYEITDVSVVDDGSAEAGEVYVTQYFDVDSSGQSYTPYHFANGGASGFDGIGSEYDFVEANGTFDDFGRDFAEVDIEEPPVVINPPDDGEDLEPPVVEPPDDGEDLEPPVVEPPDDGGDVDTTEGFFVISSGRVLRFNPTTGDFIEVFVPHESGGLNTPHDLTIGPDNNIYVSEYYGSRVLRYNGATGDFIDVFASGGGLNRATSLSFGPDGNLYVNSHDSNEVLRYDGQTGDFIDVFASEGEGGLYSPEGLTFGPDGNLYISYGLFGEVLRYDGQTGDFIDVFASDNGLHSPDSLTFGPDGNLYLANLYNNVLRYDGQTGDFIDVFVPEGSGGLDFARDITFGADGHLYVSSASSDEILRYDGVTGDFIDVFASNNSLGHPIGLIFVD